MLLSSPYCLQYQKPSSKTIPVLCPARGESFGSFSPPFLLPPIVSHQFLLLFHFFVFLFSIFCLSQGKSERRNADRWILASIELPSHRASSSPSSASFEKVCDWHVWGTDLISLWPTRSYAVLTVGHQLLGNRFECCPIVEFQVCNFWYKPGVHGLHALG